MFGNPFDVPAADWRTIIFANAGISHVGGRSVPAPAVPDQNSPSNARQGYSYFEISIRLPSGSRK